MSKQTNLGGYVIEYYPKPIDGKKKEPRLLISEGNRNAACIDYKGEQSPWLKHPFSLNDQVIHTFKDGKVFELRITKQTKKGVEFSINAISKNKHKTK